MHIGSSLKSCFSELSRLSLHSELYYGGLALIVFWVRVEGESMWPELVPGKRYLASGLGVVRVGDCAVFRNPKDASRIFVKKVAEVCGAAYRMESLVSWGSSGRDFGLVPREYVLGKIWK